MNKMLRIYLPLAALLLCLAAPGTADAKRNKKTSDRDYWVASLTRIAEPVLVNLSQNTLRKNMPVETHDGLNTGNTRYKVTHLEALGRTFCGIAPWLDLGPGTDAEGRMRTRFIDLTVQSIANAVNKESPDYMPFNGPGGQPLVDAAFFAHGLIRSKHSIWPRLDSLTQQRVIEELKASRRIKPSESNWLMFSAMVEAALLEFTGDCKMETIVYAFDRHQQWYKGDGWYGDGARFHFDYYNSYVIQPMLVDVAAVLQAHGREEGKAYATYLRRMTRFAAHQEHMISPEGTYPVIGRSMGYRFGAFQALAHTTLLHSLPEDILPAQVRCALTAVLRRQLVPETFDKDGWLTLGFCGHQRGIADTYVSTGSAYLCTFIFLPLGLPAEDAFWADPAAAWSSQKAWSGAPVKADHALSQDK